MSPLARWQAQFVKAQLLQHHPHLTIHIEGIKTQGDKWLQSPLYKIGGKGLFVKELEEALLQKKADIAVHSLKDMPAFFPTGLGLAAICEREDPQDAWICPHGHSVHDLAPGSRVGTSSLRRQVQLQSVRPDLTYLPLRGNVETRLQRCLAGEWDAIVLAVAGLKRLNLLSHATHIFQPQLMLPAVGQGALGVECRVEDTFTWEKVAVLDHLPTRRCIEAERSMNQVLGGSCQVPIAGFATLEATDIHLWGRVGDPRTHTFIEAVAKGTHPIEVGKAVAEALLAKGAKSILEALHE